jgi:hypothetical protein
MKPEAMKVLTYHISIKFQSTIVFHVYVVCAWRIETIVCEVMNIKLWRAAVVESGFHVFYLVCVALALSQA